MHKCRFRLEIFYYLQSNSEREEGMNFGGMDNIYFANIATTTAKNAVLICITVLKFVLYNIYHSIYTVKSNNT